MKKRFIFVVDMSKVKKNCANYVRRDLYAEDIEISDDILHRVYLRDYKARRPGRKVDKVIIAKLRAKGFGDFAKKHAPPEYRLKYRYTVADVVVFKDGAVHYKTRGMSLRALVNKHRYTLDDIVSVGGIDWQFYKQYIHNLQDYYDRTFFTFKALRRLIMEKEGILQKMSKDEMAKALLKRKIEDQLDELVSAAIDLAKGIKVKKGDGIYEVPPDKDMLKYILDQYFGKPAYKKQSVASKSEHDLQVDVVSEE